MTEKCKNQNWVKVTRSCRSVKKRLRNLSRHLRSPNSPKQTGQIPKFAQIKRYIYTIYTIGVIDISIAVFYLSDQAAPQWLMTVGFLLTGIAFLVVSIMLKKYPALSPSFLAKRSRHCKEDDSYGK
jgi:hypothetical protein